MSNGHDNIGRISSEKERARLFRRGRTRLMICVAGLVVLTALWVMIW